MSIKIEEMPTCPKCRFKQTIGKVKSYDLDKRNYISAYYCSNCLTEFDKGGKILRPLWTTDIRTKTI